MTSTANDTKDSKDLNNDMKPNSNFKYYEGEKVLCYHGPLIYVAKCLQTRYEEKSNLPEYFIHYSGWNKSWDEWVPEGRVLKHNEANLKKQSDLLEAQKNEKNKKKKKRLSVSSGPETSGEPTSRASTPVNDKENTSAPLNNKEKEKTSAPLNNKEKEKAPAAAKSATHNRESPSQECAVEVSKKRKARTDSAIVEIEQPLQPKIEIKIKIPDDLKPWLIDDWELISDQKKLVNLPATITVHQILQHYLSKSINSKSTSPQKEKEIKDLVYGLQMLFNIMLGNLILYKFERYQYGRMLELYPDTPMSKIYGSIHLLRLFVKLHHVMAIALLGEENIQSFLVYVDDFLKFLSKNSATYFSLQNYGLSSSDYQRKAL